MLKEIRPLSIYEDEFSYFLKFNQLADIVGRTSECRYSLSDSAYIPIDEVFPNEKNCMR